MPLKHLIFWPTLLILFVLLLVSWIFIFSPPAGPPTSNAAPAPKPTAQQTEPEIISDPTQTPTLADAAGRDAFTGNCLNCHSARYVLMQPRFPRKVWKVEVTKMVEAYKAQIAPAQQEEIVNYLTAAYGVEG
jgi:mono/diheme cytochrome c family protein